MLENQNHEGPYRDALDHLESAWRGSWADGRPATPKQILAESIADYLANCLQCGEFERGISMYQKLGGSTKFVKPRTRVAGEFGYWACLQRASASYSVDQYIAMGSHYLAANLESDWLAHGLARTAAYWLKIVFWHTGVCQEPLSTILKAYEFMPRVPRPSFV